MDFITGLLGSLFGGGGGGGGGGAVSQNVTTVQTQTVTQHVGDAYTGPAAPIGDVPPLMLAGLGAVVLVLLMWR